MISWYKAGTSDKATEEDSESDRPQFTLQTLAALIFFLCAVLTLVRDAGTIHKNTVDVGMLKIQVRELEMRVESLENIQIMRTDLHTKGG